MKVCEQKFHTIPYFDVPPPSIYRHLDTPPQIVENKQWRSIAVWLYLISCILQVIRMEKTFRPNKQRRLY